MQQQTLAPIDRKRLKSDLRTVAKLTAKIASAQIRAFVKDNEIELPLPSLVLSQGLRLILLSKVDNLCRLPDAELANVLRLLKWHLDLVLPDRSALDQDIVESNRKLEERTPVHEMPAMRASIERVLEALTSNGSAMSEPDEPELTRDQLRQQLEDQ